MIKYLSYTCRYTLAFSTLIAIVLSSGCDALSKKTKPWEKFANNENVKLLKDHNGVVYEAATYKDGVRHGISEIYTSLGAIASQKNYVNDKIEGKAVYYYTTGEIYIEINFVNNLPHGTYRAFYKDEKPKRIKTFVDGLPTGVSIAYFPEGQVQSIKRFQNGKLHGIAEFFNKDGKHVKVNRYVKSVLYETQYPDEKGKVPLADIAPKDDFIRAESLPKPTTKPLKVEK